VDCGEFAGFNRAGEGQLQCCFTEMPAGSAEAGQLPDTGPDRTTTAYTGA
jgi:hypothetical protein